MIGEGSKGFLFALVVALMFAEPSAAQTKRTTAASEDPELADVSSQLRKVAGDAKKQYFLIRDKQNTEVPAEGHSLLIVLPGGDGSAEFNPFVRRIYRHALSDRWLVAQVIAPQWSKKQAEAIVWPTESDPFKGAKFSTETLIEAIIADVRQNSKIDPARIFVFGWSSGGPPCYAAALREKSPVRGAFIAMSIFNAADLPPLENGKNKSFYLLQSPDDRMTRLFFAEKAEKSLKEAGAQVHLERYPGGHGWQGNVWQMIRDGVDWLENTAPTREQ